MKNKNLTFSLFLTLIGFSTFLSAQSWNKTLPGIGTFSSPRVSDLNGDGIKDVILGGGRAEFQSCDSAVFALDGKSGALLWTVSARDQIFGSAALKDINNDGVEDVFINGRSAELKAINGKNGAVLWEFYSPPLGTKAADSGWYNFYNPQFIPDQDNDGIEDILVSNGGDVLVEPYDPNRPAGHLVVISAKTGKLIAKAAMPDGKEIYMSVAVTKPHPKAELQVIFGTGGETVGGNLFTASLKEIMNEDLSNAIKLASGKDKGFIAPPVWVDITNDNIKDIVANSVDGRMLAFDGKSLEAIWETKMEGTEAYTSLTIGLFNDDSIPDFFASVATGVWPKLNWNQQFMVNGANGNILYTDSLGFYQTSSGVSTDLTGNGRDEVVLSVNYQVLNEFQQKFFYTMLVVIDFTNDRTIRLLEPLKGSNLSSTPWIGDLDGNGKLDIIYVHGTNDRKTYTFDGMKVMRLSTDVLMYKKVRWGAYMGTDSNGVYSDN